jgi:predicted protein tyrosine phosphatase
VDPHPVTIASLNGARDILTSDRAAHLHAVVSIGHRPEGREAEGEEFPLGYRDFGANGRQVKYRMNIGDISHLAEGWENWRPHRAVPLPQDTEELIDFLPKIEGPVLFHCYAGMSRSPAAALTYLAWALGPGNEAEIVARLFEVKPRTTPNYLMAAYADILLGHGRRLYEAMLVARGSHISPELGVIYRQARALIRGGDIPFIADPLV